MADMYRQATGRPSMASSPSTCRPPARFLAIVGPVSIEGVAEPITRGNVGRLLLHDFYKA